MASLKTIKLRIRSVKSTQKITKAMEMIAASKMKRAQTQALKGRPYLYKLKEILADLIFLSEPPLRHPLLLPHKEVKNVGYVFATANRGLCGSFNTNVIRTMLEILSAKNEAQEIVITVGRKGSQAMERIGKKVLADFENISEKPSYLETIGISKVIMDDFLAGKLDEVYMVYNHFFSTMTQRPMVVKLLPVELEMEAEMEAVTMPATGKQADGKPATGKHADGKHAQRKQAQRRKSEYIFEPDKALLLDELLRRYVETMVYQTILETAASEHSARMMAMRQASDNAHDIVSNLTLHYNKARQAKITKEILEVVAGAS